MKKRNKILILRLFKSLNFIDIKRTFGEVKKFDKVSEFRLKNSYFFSISFNLLVPVIVVLKGTLILPWIIGIFGILNMIIIKTNEILTKLLTLNDLFRISNILQLIFILISLIYFYSPKIMIFSYSFFGLIEIMIISAYTIKLNNYISVNFPKKMNKFQIIRNNIWSNGALIGLCISSIILFLFNINILIKVSIIFEIILAIWLFKNWNFFKE